MSDFKLEIDLWNRGFKCVAGIDEVGRGPLAGPVVAAAVIFPATKTQSGMEILQQSLSGVDDSKKLSPILRKKLLRVIRKQATAISIAAIYPPEIDDLGIGKAVYRCMVKAVKNFKVLPDFCLIDGLKVPQDADYHYFSSNSITSKAVVKGDAVSLSISAASIVAKVVRDRLMSLYALKYPGYGFDKHKGYGTEHHLANLERLGPCPIHRFSFSPLTNYELSLDEN